MRHTASRFTELDSCQQRVCSLDPLYAKYIQYHVWKQSCFGIQLLTPSSVSVTTSLCPHCLPCSGWLLTWIQFSLCCFFSVCLSLIFPFSVLLLSLPVSLAAHWHPWYLSYIHLSLTIDPQCEGWREARAQWFISEDCTHYRGQQRGWMHGTQQMSGFFPLASLKRQITYQLCHIPSATLWISAS